MKFQLSIKFNLVPNQSPVGVYFGFTQKSLWNLWDFNGSSPFKDSNYNPSLFISYTSRPRTRVHRRADTGVNLYWARLIGEHESNGMAGLESRSWNRISAAARLGGYISDRLYWMVQPKAWIPFVNKTYDADGGGNPDLLDYVGYGQLGIELGLDSDPKANRYQQLVVGTVLRMGTSGKGSSEAWLRWRPPCRWFAASVYLQYFVGYDESLLGYNLRANSFRFGLALDDLLPTASSNGFMVQ